MSSDVLAELTYVLKIQDNVSPTLEKVSAAEKTLEAQTKKTKEQTLQQNVAFVAQIAAVSAVYAGVNILSSSVKTLGLVSDETAVKLEKISASVGIVVGSFQLLRGAVQIVNMLKTAEIGLAAVETYRSVLKSPAKLAFVAVAAGAAAGTAGYVAGRSSGGTTTNTQNITFTGVRSEGDRMFISRQSLEIMGG